MMTGYDKPLYILPFDHRHSFITGVFHWQDALTADQVANIVAGKQVIYDGFNAAIADSAVRDRAGILVDERFGAAVLRDASARATSRAYPPRRAVRTSSTSSTAMRLGSISRP
jgi:5-dehydro-2-deoxygluconokinase